MQTLSPSKKNMAPAVCYEKHKQEKKRAYEQPIREEEHSPFILLVLAVTGCLGVKVTSFYKHLPSKLSQKWGSPTGHTLLATMPSGLFSLHSSIQTIRGAISSHGNAVRSPGAVNLVTTELRILDDL